VVEHTIVNSMNQEIAPQLPICLGRHFDFVPRAAFEAGAASRKIDQAELAALGTEIAMGCGGDKFE
jgi:hypothetical protein